MTDHNYKPLILAVWALAWAGSLMEFSSTKSFQTHAMLTAKLPKSTVENVSVNMFWDGMFHALTWTMTLVGLILLWRAVTKHRVHLSTKCYAGSMFLGWGLFNFVEGIIDHHILHLHHVVENLGVSVFDYAFLASGVILMGIGWAMVRVSKKDEHLLTAGQTKPAY